MLLIAERDDKLDKIAGISYLVLFSIVYAFFLFDITTVSNLSVSTSILIYSYIYDVVVIYSLFIAGLKIVKSRKNKKGLLIFILKVVVIIIVVAYDVYAPQNAPTICATILLALSADQQSEDHLYKTIFYISVTVLITLFLVSAMGIIPLERNNVFGFGYRTYYACFVLCMMLVYSIYKDGRFTWIGEAGLFLLTIFIGFVVKGRTAFLCLFLLYLGTTLRHYIDNEKIPFQTQEDYGTVIAFLFKILYLPAIVLNFLRKLLRIKKGTFLFRLMKYSFIICAAVTFILTFSYMIAPSIWNNTIGRSSFVSRLFQNAIGLEEFPINLLGNMVNQSAPTNFNTTPTLYFVLDSSYVGILIQNGILIYSIIIGLMTWGLFRLYKARRYYAMFVVSVFALDCIMECQLAILPFNSFILLAFCQFTEKPGIEISNSNTIRRLKARRYLNIALISATILLVFLFGWRYITSPIVSWRGQTPDYDATVIVPGDFLEGDSEKRLTRARYYLNAKKDSVCLVCKDQDQEWLQNHGIDEKRIIKINAGDIDSMLLGGKRLIDDLSLPPRLTVCTYEEQQARVEKHANSLHIPINSLTLKTSLKDGIGMMIVEGWRLLWDG